MSEPYKDPTPAEASTIHGKMIAQHKEALGVVDSIAFREKERLPDAFFQILDSMSNASSLEEFDAALARLDTDNDLHTFRDIIHDMKQRQYDLDSLKGVVAEKSRSEKEIRGFEDESTASIVSRADSIASGITEYSDRFEDKLHTAALAMAALEGIQIDHPDAIKIKK
ncbi:MAG: hypothetical protein V4611_02210 [Patescibacteria group bacterium]